MRPVLSDLSTGLRFCPHTPTGANKHVAVTASDTYGVIDRPMDVNENVHHARSNVMWQGERGAGARVEYCHHDLLIKAYCFTHTVM